MKAGQAVDPMHGQRAKQRSVHNTYFTLPVLIAMLSNHYGLLYGARHNWLVLVLVMAAGALIRHFFVARHKALVQAQAAALGLCDRRLRDARRGRSPGSRRRRDRRRRRRGPVAFRRCRRSSRSAACMCHNAQLANKGVRARHAGRHRAARAGAVPAGRAAEDHAAEQRDADHRRRARAARALVRGRREGAVAALTPALSRERERETTHRKDAHDRDHRPPRRRMLPAPRLAALGLQHVLVMYAGAIAVPLIVGRALQARARAGGDADLGGPVLLRPRRR